jgi:hypothetical protein
MIDIRSDTVTLPTEEMRRAMAGADVGDDVYGDDPTVNRLEELGAEMLGKEAAVFVPSGTFGNQLALFTWCARGTELVLGEDCHILVHEAGAAAVIAGVQTRPVPAPDGVLSPFLRQRLRKRDLHTPETSLICLENAHSLGRVVPLEEMDAVRQIADEWGLPVHLDGARIFNAAAALGVEAREIAARADSVMFCLSKGLCAPVGSLLAGKADFVREARIRKYPINLGGKGRSNGGCGLGKPKTLRPRNGAHYAHPRGAFSMNPCPVRFPIRKPGVEAGGLRSPASVKGRVDEQAGATGRACAPPAPPMVNRAGRKARKSPVTEKPGQRRFLSIVIVVFCV